MEAGLGGEVVVLGGGGGGGDRSAGDAALSDSLEGKRRLAREELMSSEATYLARLNGESLGQGVKVGLAVVCRLK